MKKIKTKNLILGAVALAVIFFVPVSFTKNNHSVSDNPVVQDTVITGQELFRLNCAGCHGIDRKGIQPIIPSLINIKEKLTRTHIREQIKNGKGLMPSLALLSEKEMDAIIGFLYEEKEQYAVVMDFTPVKQGEMLFNSSCASCHRATVNNPKPPNANTMMCSMMEPAVLAGTTRRFTKSEFLDILETGICYMPSFDYLKDDEKEALYTYLKTLEGKGEPKRPTMGERCPMIKRGKWAGV